MNYPVRFQGPLQGRLNRQRWRGEGRTLNDSSRGGIQSRSREFVSRRLNNLQLRRRLKLGGSFVDR